MLPSTVFVLLVCVMHLFPPGLFYSLCSLFFSVVPGVFVFSPKPTNVTVMFPSGTGVQVRAGEGVMTLTVLLPHDLHNHTQGLLGTMNDDPEDEFTSSNGLIIPSDSSAQDIFSYCAGCE